MMSDIVSIVVPCYNVEEYIDRCVNSIIGQDYHNIELILVNDCSTDKTKEVILEIIDKYKKSRIGGPGFTLKLIDLKQNVGLGSVRDTGIGIATGKYIMFIDSDDWIEPTTVSSCVKLINEENADLVEFGYKRRTEFIPVSSSRRKLRYDIYNGGQNIERRSDHISCNKMYKLDLIVSNNLRFKYRTFEDTLFTRKYAMQCNRAVFVKEDYYNYYCNPTSITSTISIEKLMDNERTEEVLQFYYDNKLAKRAKEYIKASKNFLLKHLLPHAKGSHPRFVFKNENGKFAITCQREIESFNRSNLQFKLKVYRAIGLKASVKEIIKNVL